MENIDRILVDLNDRPLRKRYPSARKRVRWLNKRLTKLEVLRRGEHERGNGEHGERMERHPAWLKILAASLANYKHSAYIVSRPKDSAKIHCKIACH